MRTRFFLFCLLALAGCEGPTSWQAVTPEPLAEAVLSIGGRSASDLWAVGADKGAGPLALHYDGAAWARVSTGSHGALWWVHAFADGTVYAAGAGSTILRWDGSRFQRMPTPGVASYTVFGVWGRSPDDAYAVGSVSGRDGFVWHYDGQAWREVEVPSDLPADTIDAPGFFKVCGNAEQVFVVGAHGNVLRSTRGGPFERVEAGVDQTLFTVAVTDDRVVAVGGAGQGKLIEGDPRAALADATPAGAALIQGVDLRPDGHGLASGADGALWERVADRWRSIDTGLGLNVQSFHAAFIDPEGGLWAVGGGVLSPALDGGVIVHRGRAVTSYAAPSTGGGDPAAVCPAEAIDPAPERSIARRWNEQILNAIRRDIPRPGVHARNLYHLSAAMWDAWAAYDDVADGVFFHERHKWADLDAARQEAISYAAYHVLRHRYEKQAGGAVSTACFTAFMRKLGYDPDDTNVTVDTPRALGIRVAMAVLFDTAGDGANEAHNYADTTGWTATNPPLVVDQPGTNLPDPDHWQPLNLAVAETQNGIVTAAGVQGYIGASWDLVTPFAMQRPAEGALYHDPGAPPRFAQPEMKDWALEVIERDAALDVGDGAVVDPSPASTGNNSLGQNDGHGYAQNPVTGQPYAPQSVPRGDFGRVLAEFWADGPKSETPPGHWNTIANQVGDSPGFQRRLDGSGPVLDPLRWDVQLYLALNGAVHDAAITSWGIKRRYTTVRPISIIRAMARRGQSSDPSLPRYDADGLPLKTGVVELITTESAAPGQRHAHLRRYVGELAIRAWRGEPGDRVRELGGVRWIRALDWSPYQRRTFVTPAFPGFTSGHSTFSRAAAEVLSSLTGSPYFPGGLGEYVAQPGSLGFEHGPSVPVRLQWATYYDAADQAGQSRLWGGIHIAPDDFSGRRTGSLVGQAAVALARRYFDGSAR